MGLNANLWRKFLGLTFALVTATAASADQTAVELVRNKEKLGPLTTKLSKQIFRTEKYQAKYPVEVSYQAQETYHVQVPYQATETYTDYVRYTDHQRVCQLKWRFEQRCSQVQVCDGGTSAGGIGHDGSGGRKCHSENRCSQVPVPYQDCRDAIVWKTRPVSKTRTVTKYRDETKTRTVTRYRTEERCCVTKERQVHERTVSAKVALLFPAEAVLTGKQREIFRVELQITDGKAAIKVVPVRTVFQYEPKINDAGDGKFAVDMVLQKPQLIEDSPL